MLVIHDLDSGWDDEELYQQSRSIIIAQVQHITFTEYLPLILGDYFMNQISEASNYDSSVDPSVSVAFSTAALRFGHSQIPELLRF